MHFLVYISSFICQADKLQQVAQKHLEIKLRTGNETNNKRSACSYKYIH